MTKLILSDSTTEAPLRVTERSAAPTSPNANDIYLDDGTNTGSGNPGWRRYTGSVWEDVSASAGGSTLPVVDTTSIVEDPVDGTKEMRIDVGNVSTATTRVLTMPDADVDLGQLVDQDSSQVYAADAGSTDAYAITLSPAPSAYAAGQVFHFDANTVNTGAATLNVNSLGAKTIKKHHDQDLANGDIEAGQHVTVIYDGINFQMQSQLGNAPSGGAATSIAILVDSKTTGTDAGGCTAATWNARDLNTEQVDPDGIVTVASNQFTPISGTYRITAYAPCRQGQSHRLRLYNVTGTASVQEGNSNISNATGMNSLAWLSHRFTANGTDAYRIDHYTSATRATDGFGEAVGDGSAEIYLVVILEKE